MEMVGEFLGIDTDKGIYTYFKRHYPEWFPKLREVHRTTFTRQAANLWVIKENLWQHLLEDELGVPGGTDRALAGDRFVPHPHLQKEPLLRVQGDEGALREGARH